MRMQSQLAADLEVYRAKGELIALRAENARFRAVITNMQAALAPTKGVQQHPAFDEYGEHRQPTGLGDL